MILTLDTETDPIARARLAPDPVCISYRHEASLNSGVLLTDDPKAEGWFRAQLKSKDIIIGANIAYDMAVLGNKWPALLPLIFAAYDAGRILDIQLIQKIIDIASRGHTDDEYSLENLCERYKVPHADKDASWRMEFGRLRGVELNYWPQGAMDYVLADADSPLLVYAKQLEYERLWIEKCAQPLFYHLAGREACKAFGLHLVSCWGLLTDATRTATLNERLESYLAGSKPRLQRAGLVRADGSRDTKKAKAYMERVCAQRGIPVRMTKPQKNRKSQKEFVPQVSLDKEACSDSGSNLLELYSDYSQADTLLSRAQDLAAGSVYPLQARYDSLLETSRVSASKPAPPLVGTQPHNFPRKLLAAVKGKGDVWVPGARECLTPRPGHVFIAADLPSAELRSLAQTNLDLFHYSVMAEQLNAGRDLHLWFGGKILGMEYEEALARADEPQVADARQAAKPCNFGFPGGMGWANFINYAWATYRVRFTEERAKHLKGVWLASFPEMAQYFAWVSGKFGDRDTAIHQHIRSRRWRGRVRYCALCNTNFQELTANGASEGFWQVIKECYVQCGTPLFDSRVVMYTHDEIVTETALEHSHEAAMRLSTVMADCFTKWHPDVPAVACTGPGKNARQVAPAVGYVYSKDLKAVWENGRLVPWKPKGMQ